MWTVYTNYKDCGSTSYRMAQIFESKILTNQGWEKFNEYKIDECQCIHFIHSFHISS